MTTYPQELWLLYRPGNKWVCSDDINHVGAYICPDYLPITDKVIHRLYYLQSEGNIGHYAEDNGKWRYRITFKDVEQNFNDVVHVHRTAVTSK